MSLCTKHMLVRILRMVICRPHEDLRLEAGFGEHGKESLGSIKCRNF